VERRGEEKRERERERERRGEKKREGEGDERRKEKAWRPHGKCDISSRNKASLMASQSLINVH